MSEAYTGFYFYFSTLEEKRMSEPRMIICPNCKSRLVIDRGLRKVYCQYCGQEIGFDSNRILRIDMNINRNEKLDHTNRVINEGDIAQEKTEKYLGNR